MKQKTFLRFTGRLWEDMEFEPAMGWETSYILKMPSKREPYRLELLKKDGTVLTSATPQVGNILCRALGGPATAEKVIGYIALHTEAALIRFRKENIVIYEDVVMQEKPSLAIDSLEWQQEEKIKVSWTASHPKPLTFMVRYLDGNKKSYLIANNWTQQEIIIDTAGLPGGKDCRVIVMASDGLRSSYVLSDPFEIREKPHQVYVVAPAENEVFQPDQPFSLIGHAMNCTAHSLPDEHLRWKVNGQVVATGRRMTIAPLLEPGFHTISLLYDQEGSVIEQKIGIQVLERTAEQKTWKELFSSGTAGFSRYSSE